MKHIFVQILEKLSIVIVFLILMSGVIGGYNSGGAGGAVLGLVGSFLFSVFFFGIVFILLEMNESLRTIRQQLAGVDSKPQIT